MKTVEEQLKHILVDMGVAQKNIVPAARLDEDLGLDSLEIVDFIMESEECCHIRISHLDWPKLRTFGDMVNCVTLHKHPSGKH
jgi:acyl carrier protein